MAEEKILDQIDRKIKAHTDNPKKIYLTFKAWNKMLKEQELTTGFCTKHNRNLGHNNLYCSRCKSEEFSTTRELPILLVRELPYEVRIQDEEVMIYGNRN